VWDIAIDPVDPAVAYYVRGYGGRPDNLVLRTKDRGVSWQSINAPTSNTGGYSQALAVRSSDRAVLVAGQEMFYQSLDFGATWTKLNAPWDSRRIFLLPNSTSLVLGSDHGLHWTDDMGKTWRDISKSISSNILYGVAVSGDTILLSSQDFGPFLSSDGGKTWRAPSGPLGEFGSVAINPADPSYCYAFTATGVVFAVSQDSCVTFRAVAGPIWQNYVSAANQNLITIDPNNPLTIYVGASDGVWSSPDRGLTLKRLNWPMRQVSNVALDPQDPLAIYVCSSSGLYQSLTGGATWRLLPIPTSSSPYVAAVSPTDSSIVLVALTNGAGRPQGGVLRSTDRGLTFDLVNQGLSTANFNIGVDQQSLAFNLAPAKGAMPVVALATTGGIYASADLGSTWQDIRFNAVPHAFSFVHWDQGYLWATTFGEGVLRSDRPLTDSILKSTLAVIGGPISFFNTIGTSPRTGSQPLQVITNGAEQGFTISVSQGIYTACGNWLSASPTSGTTTGTATPTPVTVSYTVAGLPQNTNTTCLGSVTVTAANAGGSPTTVPVTLVITQKPTIQPSLTSMVFAAVQGGSNPPSQAITLDAPTNLSFTALAASVPAGWLAVTPSSGTAHGAGLSVTVAAGALTPGEYSGSVTLTSPSAHNSPVVIPVSLVVWPPPSTEH
jgi:photosystem II stability/assembly factor-like uncharacterized protein